MLDRESAEQFAAGWIAAWNGHDLDQILSHYTDDVVFRSKSRDQAHEVASLISEATSLWYKPTM